jgi:hypothetical protein
VLRPLSKMHRGNLQRLLPGALVSRMVHTAHPVRINVMSRKNSAWSL